MHMYDSITAYDTERPGKSVTLQRVSPMLSAISMITEVETICHYPHRRHLEAEERPQSSVVFEPHLEEPSLISISPLPGILNRRRSDLRLLSHHSSQ